ncbi:hypothetical protein A4X13_0g1056 [Tilletia indica]|uniref:Uncharacterized protein n=1 Tax=Tilletia indica TaxID=43049 RepID=A0A177TFY3_9BASI|nr:hypothetical protein A4X13_0g1056 [Tilletia indica]
MSGTLSTQNALASTPGHDGSACPTSFLFPTLPSDWSTLVQVTEPGYDLLSPATSSQLCLEALGPSSEAELYAKVYALIKEKPSGKSIVMDWTDIWLHDVILRSPSEVREAVRRRFDQFFAAHGIVVSKDGRTISVSVGSLVDPMRVLSIAFATRPLSDDTVATVPSLGPSLNPLQPSTSVDRQPLLQHLPVLEEPPPSQRRRYNLAGKKAGKKRPHDGLVGYHDDTRLSGQAVLNKPSGSSSSSSSQSSPSNDRSSTLPKPDLPTPTLDRAETGRSSSSVGASQVGTCSVAERHLLAAASNAARGAVHGTKTGVNVNWSYSGLFAWQDGVTHNHSLTYQEALALTTLAGSSSDSRSVRYAAYRERCECRRCGRIRHEQVGETANLSKHTRRCQG